VDEPGVGVVTPPAVELLDEVEPPEAVAAVDPPALAPAVLAAVVAALSMPP
jgi:hypothetical protein